MAKLIKLTPGKYKEWDKFCLKSNDACFWHTTSWLEYILKYKPESKIKNLSFLLYEQSKLEAIIPLTMETHKLNGKSICEFSFGGVGKGVPGPALNNSFSEIKRDFIFKFIFEEIDRLAHQYKVARAGFRLAPLCPIFLNKNIRFKFNYLVKFSYFDISLATRLINLKESKAKLWNELRRNHRRNIQKKTPLKLVVYTSQNITNNVFNRYKKTHHKAAGRKTRPDKTFKMMQDWIKKDLAFLAAIKFNQKQVGFEYFVVYKNNVYGISAANDPDYRHFPIRHILEWEAILWMKKQGFSFYDIGLQQHGILPYDFPDKKQLNISHFKKGFGGFLVPWFRGEKFYSKKYYQQIYKERKKKLLILYSFRIS